MADDEMMVVMCDKCGARLKLKPGMQKILREVKCGKCGNRIPTSKAMPASAAPPSIAMPKADLEAPAKPAPAPAPEKVVPPPPVSPKAATPPPPVAPVVAPKPATATTADEPHSRTSTIKRRTANLGTPPGMNPVTGLPYSETANMTPESVSQLRKRNRELEDEVNVFRNQILTLENQLAQGKEEGGRFQELLQRTADAEERATELQDLWYKKEKEFRDLEAKAVAIQHERDEAFAIRDSVLNNIKDVLATYHAAEVETAKKRLHDLDERIDRFVALMRQRNAPEAPEPTGEELRSAD